MSMQFRRGNEADLVPGNLKAGEPAFTLDTLKTFVGTGSGVSELLNTARYAKGDGSNTNKVDHAITADSAATQSSSDSSTKIATTAFVHALMDYMTPIGYMFEWSPVSGGPDLSTAQKVHDYYGFGTWAEYGVGNVTVGIDTSDSNFDTAGKTYGEKTHTLTKPEMPNHNHGVSFVSASSGTSGGLAAWNYINTSNYINEGGDQPHNNIQPSIAVYRWQRIA